MIDETSGEQMARVIRESAAEVARLRAEVERLEEKYRIWRERAYGAEARIRWRAATNSAFRNIETLRTRAESAEARVAELEAGIARLQSWMEDSPGLYAEFSKLLCPQPAPCGTCAPLQGDGSGYGPVKHADSCSRGSERRLPPGHRLALCGECEGRPGPCPDCRGEGK